MPEKDAIRLPEEYRSWLKKKLSFLGTPYVFGSRVNTDARGGDIDILLLTNKRLSFSDLAGIRTSFILRFGDQKLDLVNYTYEEKSPFKDLIMLEAKAL